jgi:hypothetical protein
MTKYYVCTDRANRYKNRSFNKKITELSTDIKKKTIKINDYRDWGRQAINWIARTNAFNKFIYNTYSELYTKYNDLLCTSAETKRILNDTKQKLNEIEELYDNLEQLYNDKVAECKSLANCNLNKSENEIVM